MADFYTPPGWLNIWGFLDQVALKQFNQKIDYENKEKINSTIKNSASFAVKNTPLVAEENHLLLFLRSYSSFRPPASFHYDILNFDDLKILTNFQKAPTFPMVFRVECLHIDISEDYQRVKREISEGRRSRPNPIQWGTFSQRPVDDYPLKVTYKTGSTFPITLNNLSDVLFWKAFFETRKLVRDALAFGNLQAYVFHEDVYKEVPSIIWHGEENWYHLLAKGRIAAYIPSILSEDQVCGNIFLKEETAKNWMSFDMYEPQETNNQESFDVCDQQSAPTACDTDSDKPALEKPLINLNVYSTPWLVVLNEAYKHYGKADLGKISKDCLEDFIKAYIAEKALDIASSDIPLLAKFIRLPEQKKGRAYQSNKRKN
jgi:hypothetical protein